MAAERDESGRPTRVVGIEMDITDRVRAAAALRESEERYRAVSELTSDYAYSFRVEPDGTLVREWVTGAFTRITGYTLEELDVQGGWPSLVHPDDIPVAVRRSERLLSGQPDASEFRIVTKRGEVKWMYDHGHPLWDEVQGRVIRIIGAAQDITERRQVEQVLRQRVRETAALYALGRRVGTSSSTKQVVAAALDEVVAATAPDLALLYLREDTKLLLQSVGPKDLKFTHDETPVHIVGECLCGLAASGGEPLYSRDMRNDPRCTWNECKEAGLRSFAALPLYSGEEIIGVLGLASGTERDFGKEANFLETLAGQVAVGLQNVLLHEQVQRHADGLEERVRERTAELRRLVNAMAGREVRMAGLKEVIQRLRAQLIEAGLEPAADDPLADDVER